MARIIHTLHGDIVCPAFGPDATRGVIKGLAPHDLKKLGGQFLLSNTYHLLSYPGNKFIKNMGGLHKFMQWEQPILTDSGGYQVFSLINNAKSLKGKVDEDGATFCHPYTGEKFKLTPEKAIKIQFDFSSDIMIVLDDCRHYQDQKNLLASVHRTIAWAGRCKKQFAIEAKKRGFKPLLFAVIQGGFDYELRKFCTEELLKIGFDGFGFGGWAVNSDQTLPYDLFSYVRSLVPDKYPLYAMGAGTPEQICELAKRGYDLFDCAIPSRNGRHGLCYTTVGNIKITNAQYKDDPSPLDPNLKSPASDYPKFFLHHLFKIKDPLAGNLLTMHNLRYFNHILENKS